MRVGGLLVLAHLDVLVLGAANDLLLLGDGQGVPRGHVVDVLLHELVAAALVQGVIVTDDAEVFACRGGLRVFGAVHKTDNGAAVPVAEAVHLLQHLSNIAQSRSNSGRHIVGDGRLGRADVEVQITGSGHRGVLGATNLLELHELLRQWLRQIQGQPRTVADTQHDAGVLGRVAVRGGVVEVNDEPAEVLEPLNERILRDAVLELPDHENGVSVRAGSDLL